MHSHHRTPYIAVITVLGLSSISTYLAGEKWGPVLGFSIVGGMFTILAIVIYMLACAACIGYSPARRRACRTRMCCQSSARCSASLFLFALYAQYFSFDTPFKPAFTEFPLNWIGWGALTWLVLGIVVTCT